VSDDCLDDNTASEFVYGDLSRERRQQVTEHISLCSRCRRLVSALLSATANGSAEHEGSSNAVLGVGRAVRHRYEVLEWLGAGTMGTVYLARDKLLARQVAIKTVRVSEGAPTDALCARLRREAQAMSALSHPNIAKVYDVVITTGHTVALVLELVDGMSLRQWLRRAPRSEREIIAVFRQAGQGLHAAHEAGIIHRDFKPDNCMISKDGDVRVIDFGLAVDTDLAPGALGRGGTLAYMAPEQRRGAPVDPRADQYAFCVALYEALTGSSPAPAWTHRWGAPRTMAALSRGLSEDPTHRFESVQALLTALGNGSRQRRRWWPGAALVCTALAVALAQTSDQGARRACLPEAGSVDEVWGSAPRAKIRERILDGRVQGDDATARVDAALTSFVSTWRSQHVATCGSREDRTVSDLTFDARMQCLRQQSHQFRGLVRVLESEDGVLGLPVESVSEQLGKPGDCAAASTKVTVSVALEPQVASVVDELEVELARGRVLRRFGRFARALPIAQATANRARLLGYEPLLAAALNDLAFVLEALDDTDAVDVAREAWALAQHLNDGPQVVAAATTIADSFAVESVDPERAKYWLRHARASADRFDVSADSLLFLQLRNVEANFLRIEGEYATAAEHFEALCDTSPPASWEEAMVRFDACVNLSAIRLDLLRRKNGESALARARTILERDLAGHAGAAGRLMTVEAAYLAHRRDFAGALAKVEQALPLLEQSLGAEHTAVATALHNMGGMLLELGEMDRGLALLRNSVELRERLGSTTLGTAEAYRSLAEAHTRARSLDAALEASQRAAEIAESTLGPSNPVLAGFLSALALSLSRVGRHDDARAIADRALSILTQAQAESMLKIVAHAHFARANVELRGGGVDTVPRFRKALFFAERAYAPNDVSLRYYLWFLGVALYDEEQYDEALQHFRRLASLYEDGRAPDELLKATQARIARISERQD